MAGTLTRDKWNLDFLTPDELMGKSPDAQWVDSDFAQSANDLTRDFYAQTGKRIGVNAPHDFTPGPTEGFRRGTRSPSDNPGADKSQHLYGNAADFQVQDLNDVEKRKFLELATTKYGFTGIGFYEGGPGHLHLDRGNPRTWGTAPSWAAGLGPAKGANTVNPYDDQMIPYNVRSAILEASRESGIPDNVLFHIAKQESSFNPNNVTPNKTREDNPATGLFQLMPLSSWKDMVTKYGAKYGVGMGDIKDPRANAIMASMLMKENADTFEREVGRKPTAAEFYVQHFMGGKGGVDLVKAFQTDPKAPAFTQFPAAAENNKTIFYNKDGSAKTVGDVYNWLTHVVPADAGRIVPGDRAISNTELNLPSPQSTSERYSAAKEMAEREANLSFWNDGIPAVLRTNTATYLWDTYKAAFYQPDPSFKLTPDLIKELDAKNYPEGIRSRAFEAHSEEHFRTMLGRLDSEMQAMKTLEDFPGWQRSVLEIGNAVLDPVTLGVSALSAGVMAPYVAAAKLGKTMQIAASAGVGAASNMAGEAASMAVNPNKDWGDIAVAGGFGALLGGTFGLHWTTSEGNRLPGLSRANEGKVLDPDGHVVPDESGSTAGARYVGGNRDIQFTKHLDDLDNVADGDVPHTGIYAAPRWDAVGQLAKSPNPASRLASGLGEDAVGKEGHFPNPFAPTEEQSMLFKQWTTSYGMSRVSTFRQYLDDIGVTWKDRLPGFNIQHIQDFNRKVYNYVTETSATKATAYEDSVKKMGNAIRQLHDEIQSAAHNEGGRSVAGFEEMFNNPNYMMRVYNHANIKKLAYGEGFGDGTITVKKGKMKATGLLKVVAGAIRSAQPKLPDKIVAKLAKGMWMGIRKRGVGLDDDVMRMFTGEAVDNVEDILRGLDSGLEEEEIQRVLDALRPAPNDPKNPRAKRRVLLDENYSTDVTSKYGTARRVAFKEFLVQDADYLFRSYARQLSGATAMARWRVRNPTTGELLIDGVINDAEFENRVLGGITRRAAQDNIDGARTKLDLDNAKYLYAKIRGRPYHVQNDGSALESTLWARALRQLETFNVLRLMGQMGFAQLQDAAYAVHYSGISAMLKQIPSLRRIADADGRMVLKNGLGRDLEAAFGVGGDHYREAFSYGLDHSIQEGINPFAGSGRADRILDAAETTQDVLSKGLQHASGMRFIDEWLKQAAGRSMMQRFADLAIESVKKGGGKASLSGMSKTMINRFRSLGLADDELERVLQQIADHHEMVDGSLFKHKLAAINLDKWTDQEVGYLFTKAIYRNVNRVIQNNDPGMLNRWFSAPYIRPLLQFRQFMLGAYTKNFLHNMHLGQANMTAHVATQSFITSMIYMAQTGLNNAIRGKPLNDKMTPGDIAKAAVARSGYASLFPALADTGLGFLGMDPMFAYRTSGQPSQLWAVPVMSMMDDLYQASQSAGNVIKGQDVTKQDLKNWQYTTPFANTAPAMLFWRVAGGDLPDRPSKADKYKY